MKTINLLIYTGTICSLALACKPRYANDESSVRDQSSEIQNEFYIAPYGKDTNPGTAEAPFATFEKAKQTVGSVNNDMSGDIVVWVKGGTYNISKPLHFDAADSGADGHFVRYKAMRDEKPVLTAGQKITGWKKSTRGPSIFEAPAKGRFRQLYINGKLATRARTPNATETNWPLLIPDQATQPVRFPAQKFRAKTDSNSQKLMEIHRNNRELISEVELVIPESWDTSKLKLHRVEQTFGETIMHIDPIPGWMEWCKSFFDKVPDGCQNSMAYVGPSYYTPQPYYLENGISFLDSPGEWFLDTKKGVLLVYAPKGVSSASEMEKIAIEAPGGSELGERETILQIEGKIDAPVKYLSFEGLTLTQTNWVYPSTGSYVAFGGGLVRKLTNSPTSPKDATWTVGFLPGAIALKHAHNIQIQRNLLTQLGGMGFVAHEGVKNLLISGNAFVDVVSMGILIEDQNCDLTDERNINADIKITSNLFRRIGVDGYAASAIKAIGRNLLILYNDIAHVSHSAIMNGNGGFYEELPYARNVAIKHNIITSPVEAFKDGGAIYTQGNQGSIAIRHNVISDIKVPAWLPGKEDNLGIGIYLDSGTTKAHVYENTIRNVPYPFNQNCEFGNRIDHNLIEGNFRKMRNISFGGCFYPTGTGIIDISAPNPNASPEAKELIKKFFPNAGARDEYDRSTTLFINNATNVVIEGRELPGLPPVEKHIWREFL